MADYALEGPRWSSNTISWSLGVANYSGQVAQFGNSISDPAYVTDIRDAFRRWSDVANLTFVEVADSANVDIRFGYTSFDGGYGLLGRADYRYTDSSNGSFFQSGTTIRFDTAESYSTSGGELRLGNGVTFQSVALHEIGHALGLDHYTGSPAIMAPLSTSAVTDLTASDIDGIRAIYGAARFNGFTPFPDTYTGTDAPELMFGLEGNDTITGAGGDDEIYGNQGADVVYGNRGRDTIYGGRDNDLLFGGQDADTVHGNLESDAVYGNIGDDTLFGGQGDDTLFGGQGNDILSGDLGGDVLSGDLGADRYVFGLNSGGDLILGFNQAEGDRLDFRGQSYSFGDDGRGGTLFRLSGGGLVDVAGLQASQVNGGLFG